ncbi:MAG: PAAR domain-containing protein [Pseudomonadota bacterium]
MLLRISFLAGAVVVGLAGKAMAQTFPSDKPGVITEGSGNTTIGGAAAARQHDRTSNETKIVGGSGNVMINGKPAVTLGDATGCGGIAIGAASGVFINGKPVARVGDATTGC